MNTSIQLKQQLLALLCAISDPNDMSGVLELLLSEKEQEHTAKRLQIFRLLASRTPQREIASQLQLGIATVTRGAALYRQKPVVELERKIELYLNNQQYLSRTNEKLDNAQNPTP